MEVIDVIDNQSAQRTKYMQIVNHVLELIKTDQLHIGDRLPSLKQFETQFNVSKETLLKGLNYLLAKGIIESVYRKGYYVKKNSIEHTYRVFLLLDKMNLLRDQFYHSFFDAIKNKADIDIYFHHHNPKVFDKLIAENLNNYTHFVIATFLKEDVAPVINLIPPHKRLIIDYDQPGLSGEYSKIYQDFRSDMYDCLTQLEPQLQKYTQLILVVPKEAFHARLVIDGFLHFCEEHTYSYVIQHEVSAENFKKGNAYITFSRYDTDDVKLIKLTREHKFSLGKDIGLVSYNDTAVKEILEGGITVIMSDFEAMGKTAARLIEEKKIDSIRNPTRVVIRKSL